MEQDKVIERMVAGLVEVHTCYKEGLAARGLGAVIIEREWQLDYNPFYRWHRQQRLIYKTIDELERFKNIGIDVIGIDNFESKGKNLLDVVNEYSSSRVISAEITYDPFWFEQPKNPGWRFWRVLVKPLDGVDSRGLFNVLKVLNEL